ncbi:hypothetical protein [Mesorhizobium sp. B2-4-17]|uniref:hypothetical protein n=1 Tax=Mesorhizobium sp. B2-4-17 TaxID=2589932 RepID=UPI00112ACF62|nr:hypothetical protein [Mesorhizobium sp. B2-4-17]TPK78220.1 hypothetical protein FJ548_25135 [Mesorhizobium sp. B2-4-17]
MEDFACEPADLEDFVPKIDASVPADLADTVDVVELNDPHTATVWFTKVAAARLGAEAVTLRFGRDSYTGELTRNDVERFYEFAPGSPTDGALGVAWAAANPAAAAVEAAEWAARAEDEEREAA